MAVQIVTFYQNENIIYTVFAYKTMYIKCMVRLLKKKILNKSDTESRLCSCFKNMQILRSVKVRIEVITRKLRRKNIILVFKPYFAMLKVYIFPTEINVSMVYNENA